MELSEEQKKVLDEPSRPFAQGPGDIVVDWVGAVNLRIDAFQEQFARELAALHARVAALEPKPVPARSGLDEFTRPKTGEWPFRWEGRPDQRPNSLPDVARDKLEAITRARWGYDPEGRQVAVGPVFDRAWKAVDAIRVALTPGNSVPLAVTQAILARFEGVDPEFACFGTLIGLWAPTFNEELDGKPKPADFKGTTVDSYIKQFQNVPAAEEP